ncbi:hypothetical protein PVAND_015394 [Polypedilum vanderplanki]|uniref:Uncharacterized protein n=1 Tax=Polypedilum vanderplanki TaxID=319348 RepID=A0A9J6BCH1_POLVA|nr:hypothetical protein PVAND_015394 [Polypedilum vanderplanki]
MMHASSKPYENHHLILEHIDSHMSHEMDDHIPQYYKKSSISSTSSPEPPHHMYRPQMPPQHQQFRVIKDTRQIYDDGGYQVSSSEHSKIMEIDQPMAPPPPQIHAAVHNNAVDVPTQKVKIINSNEEPTSSIPDLGEFKRKKLKILFEMKTKILKILEKF